MTLREFAPAKLNLALHVRGRMADGYHAIETLFAFADIGDELTATPADGLSLTMTGPFAAGLSTGRDNLVIRAASLLGETIGRSPDFAFTLEKRLPVASGIGGGSADAAAALRLLARAWDIAPDDARLAGCARALGADVPACLLGASAIGSGRGEALRPIPLGTLAGAPILLANPGVPVSTAQVFARWDGADRGALPDGDAAAILENGRNDLQPPAIMLVPAIAELLDAMTSAGARTARMSGSGATCFAAFECDGERDAALGRLRTALPGHWIVPARFSISGIEGARA